MRSDAAPEKRNERGHRSRRWRLLSFLLVLCVGVIALLVLQNLRKPPQRARAEVTVPKVRVRKVVVADTPVVIRGFGTVSPKVELDIVPEVAGRVVYVHSELKTGGLIRAHERILQIDPLDYELAVRQARAGIDEAQARLDVETAEAQLRRQLNPEADPDSPLVSREPQIRAARASLESARAQLAVAELRLQRTAISLPFDVLVVGEGVDLGHYLAPGQAVAKAYGTDAFEIEVGLEDRELAWVEALKGYLALDVDLSGSGSLAVDVKATLAGHQSTWDGHIVRAAGRVDGSSGKVPLIVEVQRPLDVAGDRPPLLPGTSAEVLIAGGTLENAVAVPWDAIEDGNRIWLVRNGRLSMQELDIVRADERFAYVTSGLPDGAEVVISATGNFTEGMQVRIQPDGTDREERDDSETDTLDDKERQ